MDQVSFTAVNTVVLHPQSAWFMAMIVFSVGSLELWDILSCLVWPSPYTPRGGEKALCFLVSVGEQNIMEIEQDQRLNFHTLLFKLQGAEDY